MTNKTRAIEKKFYLLILFFYYFVINSYSQNILTNVYYTQLDNTFNLTIRTTNKLKYSAFALPNPDRIVIDLKDTTSPNIKGEINVNISLVSNIKISQYNENITRIVIYLKRETTYECLMPQKEGKLLIVKIPLEKEYKEEKVEKEKKEINNITYEKINNKIKVKINATSELKYELKESDVPPRITLLLPNFELKLPKKILNINQEPIKTITTKYIEDKSEIIINLSKLTEYTTEVSPDKKILKIAFVIPEAPPEEREKEEKKKEVAEINKLETVKIDDKLRVTISATKFLKYEIEEIKYPARIKLTFIGFTLNLPKNIYVIDTPPVKKITIQQLTEEKIVAKIELMRIVKYDVTLSENAKSIILEFVIPEELKELYVKKEEIPKPEVKEEVKIIPTVNIKGVIIEKQKDKAIIKISADKELKYKISELTKPFKLLIEMYNARLIFPQKTIPIELGVLKQARVYQYKTQPINIARCVIDLKKKIDHKVVLTPDKRLLTLTAYTPIVPVVKIEKKPPEKVVKKPKVKVLPPEKIVKPLPPIPTIPKERVINMDFKDADIRDVLRILGEIGKINIVVAEDVPAQPITISLKRVPLSKALDLVINTARLAHRMFDNTLIVASSWDTIKKIGTSVLIGDYKVETFYIKGYTTDEFKKILEKSVPEAEVIEQAADRPKDTITVVGTAATLERVRSLIKSLKKPIVTQTETFNLGFLDPEEVSKALKKAIPEVEIVGTKTSPNLITVAGTEKTLKRVAEFFYKMKLLPALEFKTIEIRDLKPDEVEKLLKNVLPGVSLIRAQAGSDTISITLSGSKGDLDKAKTLIEELQGGPDRANIAKSIEVFKLKNFDTLAALQEIEGQDITSLLKAMVPGLEKAGTITIDERTNSIIVRAPPSDLEKVKVALEKIDVKLPQVLIEARVVDMSSSAAKTFNMSLVERVTERKEPFQIQTTGDKAGMVTMTFNLLKKDFILTLNSLIQEGSARTLASPKVATISGKQAEINLSDNIPYIIEEQTTTEAGAVVVTRKTEIQSVGIKLTITPRVQEDKTILLRVFPSVETIVGRITPGQKVATNKREVETLLRIKDGDSIVIGGLINATERETISRIPFLSQLPILGKLFTTKSKEVSDAELVVILTANILPY